MLSQLSRNHKIDPTNAIDIAYNWLIFDRTWFVVCSLGRGYNGGSLRAAMLFLLQRTVVMLHEAQRTSLISKDSSKPPMKFLDKIMESQHRLENVKVNSAKPSNKNVLFSVACKLIQNQERMFYIS